jgi:hypothetical protein
MKMKRVMVSVLMTFGLIGLIGCSAASRDFAAKSQTARSDIFEEVSATEALAPGFADLTVKASLKTHLPGEGSLFEPKNCGHGGPSYPFTLNVDGQAVTWEAPGRRDYSHETADCMYYELEKRIRLRPGSHQISFAAPGENSGKTVTVNLQEGRLYSLEFEPIYPRHKFGPPCFQMGFLGFNATMNNISLY